MSKRFRITLLSTIIGLLLLGSIACPTVDAQGNDYPIGLRMQYNIAVYIDDPLDYPDYDYDITFNFTRWIDEENNVVEYSRNHDGVSATFVQSFSDVHVDIPGNPPIWNDVATWEISDMYEFSGVYYEVHRMVTGGSYEWFLLWNVTQSANLVIRTMLGYHSPLGILVDYDRETNSTDGSSPYEKSDLLLTHTNLYDYYPLINDSPPATSTTSTTSTSQPTSTSDISGPNTNLPLLSMDVFLSVGIVIESIIIVLLFSRRQQPTLRSET